MGNGVGRGKERGREGKRESRRQEEDRWGGVGGGGRTKDIGQVNMGFAANVFVRYILVNMTL